MDKYSECCGKPVYVDSDICMDCNEHCQVLADCEKCEDGQIEQHLYTRPGMPFGGSVQVFEFTNCPHCNGTGSIEYDE